MVWLAAEVFDAEAAEPPLVIAIDFCKGFTTEIRGRKYAAVNGAPRNSVIFRLDLPGKSGERFSVYAASASKRHGLL
ncbi:hypothetical protein, partial [Magnetospirillum sulfuroxidans]